MSLFVRGRPASVPVGIVHSMEPTQSGTDESDQTPSPTGTWLFPALLTIVLIALIYGAGLFAPLADRQLSEPPKNWQPSVEPTGETVALKINFGNGASKVFAALPWRPELTVAEVLEAAQEFRPGIQFVQKGSGSSGFLVSLDGLANQGASGRNWIYQLDGQHATQSFCVQKIEPGMQILWTFTDQLYNEQPVEE